ncbi:formate dehydrogenase subunit alpha [Limobrevibacterium gyesilva]|uniref:Formate dehydrogenase subunit alpha n=1 Tax=Limobrevibacterium gyesilva TaxID=2991712 RepID=A0AA42CGT1_9PROT|nr:formate dehydrogenase subunit alpha [Limobrevibacterium gyesilva]MCW3474155.1 formate dehydrogenase subunit alpha [Limobrevibacterium gyesilva]
MLIKRREVEGVAAVQKNRLQSALGLSSSGELACGVLDRRSFLRRAGFTAGAVGMAGLALGAVRRAEAAAIDPKLQVTTVKAVCTHCSVGCTVVAEVQNGVWVRQEPDFDSPINRGSHCAKGAAVRELVKGARRLRSPMKLVDGAWQKLDWETALNEISAKLLEIRAKSGPDGVFWLGSAKFSNEGAYLYRKFGAFWGTNSVDHQARICHSTTVAGVANVWGYGAMTNSYNDLRNSKTMVIMGGNPAEAHPVSLQHILSGKELNRANLVVIDPRFTRTAAHATDYIRIRPGTDIPVIWGILWHVFQNGWEDKDFIAQRVYGMDEVRKEVAKWTPDEVERVSGAPGEQLKRVAEMMAKQRPATMIWCMGATQKTVGTANVRAHCTLLLATGNVGTFGAGANIFRGHCNVQGATDVGLDVTTLPFYYGLAESAWRHWARVWEVEYDWLLSRFEDKKMMETPGIPTTRWFDAVLLPKDQVEQRDNVRGMVVFGHGGNTVTRMPEMVKGLEKLELLVVADPHPTTFAVVSERRNGTYLLPVCTQFETSGSRTASNRSLQWSSQVVAPIWESRDDYEVMYRLAEKLGFADRLFKNIKVDGKHPSAEDILREMNRGAWSTGYTGQSPERLKAHMANQNLFDVVTLRASEGPVKGDYYGLPWPCFGTPEMRHPGTHTLYNTNLHVKDGGGTFRARFGVERNGVTLLAEGSYSKGSEIKDGYPEVTMGMLKKLGWDGELSEAERAVIARVGGANIDAVSWATDLSGGIQRVSMEHGLVPYGNAKARAVAWNLPDPVPVHREPIYTPRPDLVAKYPALPDFRSFRLANIGATVQKRGVDLGVAKNFPIVLTSGRLVEYEGGGEETRSNPWLAELQQNMYVEINPADAAERGIKDGAWVWVTGAESGSRSKVKAWVTERVGKGVAFMPFHFSGWFMGVDQRAKYPKGADPIVLGESANTLTTYGYDPVTAMQEAKVTLCQIAAA